MRRTERI